MFFLFFVTVLGVFFVFFVFRSRVFGLFQGCCLGVPGVFLVLRCFWCFFFLLLALLEGPFIVFKKYIPAPPKGCLWEANT